MIKKFEVYNPKKLDTQFIIDAFADLIDDGLAEYELVNDDYEYFEIYVELGENLYQEGYMGSSIAGIANIINTGEKQLEIIKDINTAILRIKDELNIEPFMEFMTYGSDDDDKFKFHARIEYSTNDD